MYVDIPDGQTAGIPLESIDLCFAPGVNPIKEADRIRALIKDGKGDQIALGYVEPGQDGKGQGVDVHMDRAGVKAG